MKKQERVPVSPQTKAAARDPAGMDIELQTAYLADPVAEAHLVTIRGLLHGKGQVVFDPNACSVTPFGDREACTRIATNSVDVELARIRLGDPTGQERPIYEIGGELPPHDHKWKYFLVGPPPTGGAYRLVVEDENENRRPITLQDVFGGQHTEPQPCKTAQYSARQSGGTVNIRAQGEHPTSGYKVFFELLPIDVFPPQFRLLCAEPAGPVPQVITPFDVTVSFAAANEIRSVTIHDAGGEHAVPVTPVTGNIEANLFELRGGDVQVRYSSTSMSGQPQLHYQDGSTNREFTGDAIDVMDQPPGRLVTVIMAQSPDSHIVTFSLVLPRVRVSSQEECQISVPSLRTTAHTSIMGPPGVLGPDKTYEILELSGTAKQVFF